MAGDASPLTRLGIGKVLEELRPAFPSLSISKIRYLEDEGLLQPERTPSGYRKFSFADIERLRFILRMQEERFWPLSHIRQVLDEMDRGQVPDADGETTPRVPYLKLAEDGLPTAATFAERPSRMRLTRQDVLDTAGIDDDMLDAIEEHGLIERRPSQTYYDGDDLTVAAMVAEFAELGLEPRHLRSFRTGADREAALVNQVLAPRARAGESDGDTAAELAALSVRLHTVLLRRRLRG